MKRCSFVTEPISDRVAYERVVEVMFSQCVQVRSARTSDAGIVSGFFLSDENPPSKAFHKHVLTDVARKTATPIQIMFMEEGGEACLFHVSRRNGRLNAKTRGSLWRWLTGLFR